MRACLWMLRVSPVTTSQTPGYQATSRATLRCTNLTASDMMVLPTTTEDIMNRKRDFNRAIGWVFVAVVSAVVWLAVGYGIATLVNN